LLEGVADALFGTGSDATDDACCGVEVEATDDGG
jgi:hypothetical protein